MIFDTHAHYDDEAYNEDRDTLLNSMKENGVGRIMNVGASMQSTKDAVALAKQYDFIYAAVGVHPTESGDLTEKDMECLYQLAKEEKVRAIGEIGLDYYYNEPPKEIQKKWFVRQIDLAKETNLPIIIHSRDAAKDTLDIIKAGQGDKTGGVVHCFSYSWEMAKIYLGMGFYLGIGGVVTFKNSKKLKEVVAKTPIEQIVLETDAPYLAPEPNRGSRNSSIQLKYVVEEIAGLKNMDPEEIVAITRKNAMDLYRLAE